MYKGSYKFAEHIFTISTNYSFFHKRAKDYVSEETPEFEFEITQGDLAFEKSKDEENSPEPYIEFIAVYRKMLDILMQHECILFHGAVISVDNQGYLFTASSGTGKTTHMRLWLDLFKNRAKVVNGDKPILICKENGVYAYGTPWNGKECYGDNSSVKLKSIIVLDRDTNNHIEPISKDFAFPYLYKQTHKTSGNNIAYIMSKLDEISSNVELYHLGCNMDPEAAIVAYKGMNKTLKFEDILLFDGSLLYTAVGTSMLPLVKEHHDLVTIVKNTTRLKKRDVALFKRDDGKYVLHRVMKVTKEGYVMCGDHQWIKEKGVREDQVLGYLTQVDKGDKVITIEDKKYKRYVRLWCNFFYIRASILWLKALPYRIKRKFFKKKSVR